MLGIFRVSRFFDGLALGKEVTHHDDRAVWVAYVLRVSHRNGEGADELWILEIDGQIALDLDTVEPAVERRETLKTKVVCGCEVHDAARDGPTRHGQRAEGVEVEGRPRVVHLSGQRDRGGARPGEAVEIR